MSDPPARRTGLPEHHGTLTVEAIRMLLQVCSGMQM